MSFTGNKDTDFLLLLNIPDADLPNFSCLNKYSEKLYNDPTFWRRKMLIRFNLCIEDLLFIEKYLGSVKDIYRYIIDNQMGLCIPWLKNSEFIEDIENLIKSCELNKFPKWINREIFLFELRKKLIQNFSEYIFDSFSIRYIFKMFSPLDNNLNDLHKMDMYYILISSHFHKMKFKFN